MRPRDRDPMYDPVIGLAIAFVWSHDKKLAVQGCAWNKITSARVFFSWRQLSDLKLVGIGTYLFFGENRKIIKHLGQWAVEGECPTLNDKKPVMFHPKVILKRSR